MDRTLLPNGHPPELPGVRDLFRALVSRPEVTLAYVSGRNRAQMMEAVAEYGVPPPDYAICDVGATIFRIEDISWHPWEAWNGTIAPAWQGLSSWDIEPLLRGISGIWKQPEANQNTHKLSYHADPTADAAALRAKIQATLHPRGIRTSIVWSIDDLDHIGMLDIMPEGSSKLHAILFLMQQLGFAAGEMVFAGDSGNDLDVLCSPLPSVLVANAQEGVRREAMERTRIDHHADALYLACGGLRGLNGNYAAGILEGVVHYHPHAAAWF
ncbi:MAG: HAD-IIB family hydrolase [Magnetococcales bacterium]|nr:HAD-IIB family hydrolase [Magnetococcales bacterium]MBF0322747.1 HAD-IIB family hydrolase [Magnetococcales bacterium]